MMVFGSNLSNVNSLKCISMSNQECKARPEIININSNEPSFYPYSFKINKCCVMISIIHLENYVFLMLLKTYIWKYSM